MSFNVSTRIIALAMIIAQAAAICSCGKKDETNFWEESLEKNASVATENALLEHEPIVWADRTYIDAMVAAGRALDNNKYTTKSFAEFTRIYEASLSVSKKADAEQAELDAAAAQIQKALDALEERADTSAIFELHEKYKGMDRSLYKESSLEHVDKAVEEIVAKVNGDISQRESDDIREELKNAIGTLVAHPLETGKNKKRYVHNKIFPARADGKEFVMSSETEEKFNKIATSRYGFGYFVLDLQTGATLNYNADSQMFQASTAKAQFCLFMYNLIDSGKASFEDELEYKKKHHSVGSGEIKETPFGSTYKLDYLIDRALTISDNCAFHMMVDNYNYKEYNKFIKALGTQYAGRIQPGAHFGYSSPRDTIKIWSEIYTYTLYGSNGAQFKQHLMNSAYNAIGGEITGGGIKDYEVAHKSGWTSAQFNDFAIVYAPHPYLIVTYLSVADGTEPKKVEQFAEAAHDVMEEYHAFMYENDDVYLPPAQNKNQGETAKNDKSNKK